MFDNLLFTSISGSKKTNNILIRIEEWVCYHDKVACIDLQQTGSVGKDSDHLQLIKFWPYRAPGKGSAAGRKFLAPPYYNQRAVFASL